MENAREPVAGISSRDMACGAAGDAGLADFLSESSEMRRLRASADQPQASVLHCASVSRQTLMVQVTVSYGSHSRL